MRPPSWRTFVSFIAFALGLLTIALWLLLPVGWFMTGHPAFEPLTVFIYAIISLLGVILTRLTTPTVPDTPIRDTLVVTLAPAQEKRNREKILWER